MLKGLLDAAAACIKGHRGESWHKNHSLPPQQAQDQHSWKEGEVTARISLDATDLSNIGSCRHGCIPWTIKAWKEEAVLPPISLAACNRPPLAMDPVSIAAHHGPLKHGGRKQHLHPPEWRGQLGLSWQWSSICDAQGAPFEPSVQLDWDMHSICHAKV
eukprot:1141621-Pelagomonas_calceolata.AAC.2